MNDDGLQLKLSYTRKLSFFSFTISKAFHLRKYFCCLWDMLVIVIENLDEMKIPKPKLTGNKS